MAAAVHVSGEALIKTGTGSASALETLGVSVDGVDIDIEDHVDPIFTDTFGPKVPFEEQSFLQSARINIRLVFYDEAILLKLRPQLVSGTEGTMSQAGSLFGASGKYFRLLILSPLDTLPWNFLYARCDRGKKVKIGTVKNVWDLNFFAIPYTGTVTSSSGAVLYNRTTS